MRFSEIVNQARALLQEKGRITHRALKREFDLDDEAFEDLKDELIEGDEVAREENGRVLIWAGGDDRPATATTGASSASPPMLAESTSEGERRHLTVMFCDLVGSTALSEHLDPEELRGVILTYQEISNRVIDRYEGFTAQYLGDGLLVYFGYPTAHDDDPARAVRAALEIVSALQAARSRFPRPIQARVGVHTGPVVVGQMGDSARPEQLALGRTPNIAARIQGCAEPDAVFISADTKQLVEGLFRLEDQGESELKGISAPQALYRVEAESPAHNRFEVAVRAGLTPLVGREFELGVLRERWRQARDGRGQVVMLSGEPGIGKSRLVEELKAQIDEDDTALRIEFRCSPYHQNSALYPIIEHLQHLLGFAPSDTPEQKLAKLQKQLERYRFTQAETLPLLATLLSLPLPDDVPPLSASPQKQREQTQKTLAAWLIEESERTPTYNAWEDLHWADPSTLELLDLLVPQAPTSPLLVLLTFRPEFVAPWGARSYLSHLTLSRLGRSQVDAMVEQETEGRALPEEVLQQISEKTDGVPLFVEELTKMVVESGLVRVVDDHYELTQPLRPLAIPSTLQDSLMARLDRLAAVREIAQLAATLGREFSYELLAAASPLDDDVLERGLDQLVQSEMVFQRGLPPAARYVFKHALIRDTAYESLLKSRRLQMHRQVAEVLEERFPETVETQPELVAYHYTEAGCGEQALPYWLRAAERASQRSAMNEAISHANSGLQLIGELSGRERARQELALQMTLGAAHVITKGFAARETGEAYTRAGVLCRELGDAPEIADVLLGLWAFWASGQSELQAAREIAEQLLQLGRDQDDSMVLLKGHIVMSISLVYQGELLAVGEHVDRSLELYDADLHHELLVSRSGYDRGIVTHCWSAMCNWLLGHPDRALSSSETAIALSRERPHPFTLATALVYASWVQVWCGQFEAARENAEAGATLAHEHGFSLISEWGTIFRGVALTALGEPENHAQEANEAVERFRGAGVELWMPHLLAQLAGIRSAEGRLDETLRLLRDGLEISARRGDKCFEAELHRLEGETLLKLGGVRPIAAVERDAETCFEQALQVAAVQSAKSFELRAAISLARLWQSQGKTAEARALLAPVYDWFTEGFDTQDLKDAKALLEELD